MTENKIILKLNPYKQINEITVNGEMISPYSELNGFVRSPFINWAYRFFQTAQKELNDQFFLTVIGEGFETKLLKDMAKCHSCCKGFSTGSFCIDMDYKERIDKFINFMSMYRQEIYKERESIEVVIDSEIVIREIQDAFEWYHGFQVCREGIIVYDSPMIEVICKFTYQPTKSTSSLYIAKDINHAQQMATRYPSTQQRMIFVFSDQAGVVWRDNYYYWGMKKDYLCRNLELYLVHYFVIPYFMEKFKSTSLNWSIMNHQDILEYQILDKVNPQLTAEQIPVLEKGDTWDIKIRSIPEGIALPNIIAKSDNLRVIQCQGLSLYAIEGGNAYVELYVMGNVIPFSKLFVTVEAHNYASKLRIEAETLVMGENHTQQLCVKAMPIDADDLGACSWKSSDSSVLSIDKNGVLKACRAGSAEITVKGVKAVDTISVIVKPQINQIMLSSTRIELYMGNEQTIQVCVEPYNCYDNRYIWESSDNKVAVVEIGNSGCDRVKSIGIGACTLTCRAVDGTVRNTCNVVVHSTLYRPENQHRLITAACIITLFAVLLIFASLGIGFFCAVAAIGTAVGAMKKNETDRRWAIACIVVCIAAVLIAALQI